jgi:hypothetical protein
MYFLFLNLLCFECEMALPEFFSRLHTEVHCIFLENLPPLSHADSPTLAVCNDAIGNAVNFGPGNPSLFLHQDDTVVVDGESILNVSANLLPPTFQKATFLTPEMVKYHKNKRPSMESLALFMMPFHRWRMCQHSFVPGG